MGYPCLRPAHYLLTMSTYIIAYFVNIHSQNSVGLPTIIQVMYQTICISQDSIFCIGNDFFLITDTITVRSPAYELSKWLLDIDCVQFNIHLHNISTRVYTYSWLVVVAVKLYFNLVRQPDETSVRWPSEAIHCFVLFSDLHVHFTLVMSCLWILVHCGFDNVRLIPRS